MSLFLQSLRGLFRPSASSVPSSSTLTKPQKCVRSLSTTSAALKGAGPPKSNSPFGGGSKLKGAPTRKSQRGQNEPRDPKMINLMRHLAVLNPKRIPAPLRMARNRYLRHWTIHRAWLMFRRREREARERTWMRQYQAMNRACEELRLTGGPGSREEGYLFRIAMEKKGTYGLKGVPIEYARAQVDTPPRAAWNHEWKADAAAAKGKAEKGRQ
ncbi:hypothetical protein QBC42DRAFT_335757 [Cladorrhinum samala]|uniref:Large ribosomal subunit protein mL40 n=1 Tax=Cladorrhinum samala TaxID=585594 RepID=A0AAV9I0Q8_9PEZI|nr:hypothetical protein QBC42DRAFT_335757 [Cladorrhinum samala]